jgi:hypothetical protein
VTARGRSIVEASTSGTYYTTVDLAAAVVRGLSFSPDDVALEPHVGAGGWAEALLELRAQGRGPRVYASDIDPAAAGLRLPGLEGVRVRDALDPLPACWPRPTWMIGNPPYSIRKPVLDERGKHKRHPKGHKRAGELAYVTVEVGTRHVEHALDVTARHVLYLLPITFLGSRKRLALYGQRYLRAAHVLIPRPSFTGTGSDSNEYAMLWWDKQRRAGHGAEIDWTTWRDEAPRARAGEGRGRQKPRAVSALSAK